MGHLCGSGCKRKTGERCDICRVGGGGLRFLTPASSPSSPKASIPTPHEKGAAVDLYFDGLFYRQIAGNMDQYFGRETGQMSIYRWVRDLSKKADSVLRPMKVDAGTIWVADEVVVKVGGQNYWLFNVMDSKSRFLLAAYYPLPAPRGRRRWRWLWRGKRRKSRR